MRQSEDQQFGQQTDQYPEYPPQQRTMTRQQQREIKTDTRGVTGRWLVETAALVLLAFVIAMGVRFFLVEPYRIPTGSMIPTIQVDDHIMIYRLGTHLGSTPDQEDVVVFYDPTDIFPNLVKRVIATEGQTVDLTPDGHVMVDGEILYEPYIQPGSATGPLPPESNLGAPIEYPFVVPEGHIFVMGDNRERSSDSRAFGPVAVSEVKGVAFFTYWPMAHFAPLR